MQKPSRLKETVRGITAAVLSGSLGVSLLAFSVQGQTQPPADSLPPAAAAEPTPSADENVPPEVSLDSYTYADLFSIGVPEGWQTNEQTDSPQVTLTHSGADVSQNEAARIEITWHDQPPEVVVAQLLNDLKKNGYQVSRYEPEGIDDTTALNIWLTDLPDGMPNAFMSYIGYADITAAVVSYYTAPNPPLESLLVEIHESFERLD